MKQYKKIPSYGHLSGMLSEVYRFINQKIEKEADSEKKDQLMIQAEILKSALAAYDNSVKTLYTPKYGRYPALSSNNLNLLKEQISVCLNTVRETKAMLSEGGYLRNKKDSAHFDDVSRLISDDREIINRINYRDNLSLPAHMYKNSGEAYAMDMSDRAKKGISFFEYSKIYDGTGVSEKTVLQRYRKRSEEELVREFRQAAEKNPALYEEAGLLADIPKEIINTSDSDKINEFLQSEAGSKITISQRILLEKHQKSYEDHLRIENERAQDYIDKPGEANAIHTEHVNTIVDDGKDKVEIVLDQEEFQSSRNGCWSVSGTLLLKSRGIDVSQEDIRNYRPHDTEINYTDDMHVFYNKDTGNVLLEKADSILNYAPDTMLKEVTLLAYGEEDEKAGITPAQYYERSVAFIKNHIKNVIRNDHSPISMLYGSHYITITGIDGDTIKYKDSSSGTGFSANANHTMSIREFVKREFVDKPDYERRPVTFTSISDIKMNREGTRLYGVPSEYLHVEDKKLVLPPAEIQQFADASLADTNTAGILIQRVGGVEKPAAGKDDQGVYTDGGIHKVEKVYLPKNINFDRLAKSARLRSLEEENRLKAQNKELLGVDVDVQPGRPATGANNPEEPADVEAVKDGRYSLEELAGEVNTMYQSIRSVDSSWLNTVTTAAETLKDNLEKLQRSLAGVLPMAKRNEQIPNEQIDQINELFADCLKEAKSYLDSKTRQMIADPGRKNAWKKQIFEQPRIRAVIGICDKLTEIVDVYTKKDHSAEETRMLNADRVEMINNYKRTLLSTKGKNKELQEDSYKNRNKMSAPNKRRVERIEALLGMHPDEGAFPEGYFKKVRDGGREVSVFRQLKRINNTFRGIGSDDPLDKLSNKDFAAAACAALYSREVFESFGLVIGGFEEQGNWAIAGINNELDNENLVDIKIYDGARQKAAEAFTAYKNGDKKLLAGLIMQGLQLIYDQYYFQSASLGSGEMPLCEMGARYMSMMERDPDLYDLAVQKGLNAKMIDAVRFYTVAMKYQSECSDDYNYIGSRISVGNADRHPAIWTDEERKDKYADMLIGQMVTEIKQARFEYIFESKGYVDDYRGMVGKIDQDEDQLDREFIEQCALILKKPEIRDWTGELAGKINGVREKIDAQISELGYGETLPRVKDRDQFRSNFSELFDGRDSETLQVRTECVINRVKEISKGLEDQIIVYEQKDQKTLTKNEKKEYLKLKKQFTDLKRAAQKYEKDLKHHQQRRKGPEWRDILKNHMLFSDLIESLSAPSKALEFKRKVRNYVVKHKLYLLSEFNFKFKVCQIRKQHSQFLKNDKVPVQDGFDLAGEIKRQEDIRKQAALNVHKKPVNQKVL